MLFRLKLDAVLLEFEDDRYDATVDNSVLYHGTTRENLKSIMTNGLDPKMNQYADDEEANDYRSWDKEKDEGIYEFGPPYDFVFLSAHPRKAAEFIPGGEYCLDTNKNNSVMLEIRLPPELQKELRYRGEFVRAPFIIPPQYIKVLQ